MSLFSRVFGNPSLSEAVKGGFQSDSHELHGALTWTDKEGQRQSAPLTHDFDGNKHRSVHDGIKEYLDVIKDKKRKPQVHFSVIPKPAKGEDPKDRFYTSDYMGGASLPYESVSRIRVGHAGHGTAGDPGDDVHFSTKFVDTDTQHRRKGWASTLFDHAHRSLKNHGVHLTHDSVQLAPGKRWAARQETARGKGFEPIHRRAQSDALSRLAVNTRVTDNFPDHKEHHDKMIDIANKILDRSGGYHGKRERKVMQRALRKAGVPPIGGRQASKFMDSVGGEPEALPKRRTTIRNKGLPPWGRG